MPLNCQTKTVSSHTEKLFYSDNFTISNKQVELTHITSNLLGPEG